jgi:transcriptional regulator with XRE-family HTH domain
MIPMNKTAKCDIHDLLELFEDALSPADVLSSKLMAQVSTAITKERLKLRMTQAEFAQHIEVTQSQVSRWERGNYNFSLEKIADIASKLNLDVNISTVDMSLYKSLEAYNNEYIVSPQIFSRVFKDNQPASTGKKYTYNSNTLKPIFSNIKEEANYVAVR